MLIKKSKIKIIRCLIALMDICVYVHVNKIIRCEYNNRGGGASEIRQTWGGACPKSLKTPALRLQMVALIPGIILKNPAMVSEC